MATTPSAPKGQSRAPARTTAATVEREIDASAETLVAKVGESAKQLLSQLAAAIPASQVGPVPGRQVPLFFPKGIGFVAFELSAGANRTDGLSAVLKLTVAGVDEQHGTPAHVHTSLHDG